MGIGIDYPNLIQQKVGANTASTTLVVTLDTGTTLHNTLIAAVGSQNNAVTGITGGGTWASLSASASHIASDLWYCPNISAGITTITITFAGSTGPNAANISEWSGLQTAPQDTHAATNGSDAKPTTGAVTPTVGDNITFGIASIFGTTRTSGPGNGYTALSEAASGSLHVLSGYRRQTTAGATSTSWTTAASAGWDAQSGAFKALARQYAFQADSFQADAFQLSLDSFAPDAFQNDAFQVTVDAFEPTAYQNDAFQMPAQASTGTNAPAELASGTGVAQDPDISLAPTAGLATGTGTAQPAWANVGPNAGAVAATGAAYDVDASLKPTAGQATGTGVAQTAKPSVAPTAGLATATGAAQDARASVKPTAGLVSGTGVAQTAAASLAPTAGTASGTGTAQVAKPSVAPTAGLATGTGAAYDATVTTSGGTNAQAEAASGTGTAQDARTSLAPTSGAASATGAAYGVTAGVKPTADLAAATGTAYQPTINTTAAGSATAGLASGTGAAWDARISIKVSAGLAHGIGTAYNMPRTGGITWASWSASSITPVASAVAGIAAGTASDGRPDATALDAVPVGRAEEDVPA